MTTQIFVPKTITVGYNEITDTYTKKLAYVIYTDNKGVLRKEASWNTWRNTKIDPDKFDNEPTEGFVLNKKVGGDRYSWNPRQTYTRVFDPRGFEFEITIPNLLYILENTNSIKGKGLEGKFVYGWAGTDLVLIPESAPEYSSMQNFTKLQDGKVGAKDLKIGFEYLTKKLEKLVYLGKFKYYNTTRNSYKNYKNKKSQVPARVLSPVDRYVFIQDKRIREISSLSILSKCTSEKHVDDFAELMNIYTSQYVSSIPKDFISSALIIPQLDTEKKKREHYNNSVSYSGFIKLGEHVYKNVCIYVSKKTEYVNDDRITLEWDACYQIVERSRYVYDPISNSITIYENYDYIGSNKTIWGQPNYEFSRADLEKYLEQKELFKINVQFANNVKINLESL